MAIINPANPPTNLSAPEELPDEEAEEDGEEDEPDPEPDEPPVDAAAGAEGTSVPAAGRISKQDEIVRFTEDGAGETIVAFPEKSQETAFLPFAS